MNKMTRALLIVVLAICALANEIAAVQAPQEITTAQGGSMVFSALNPAQVFPHLAGTGAVTGHAGHVSHNGNGGWWPNKSCGCSSSSSSSSCGCNCGNHCSGSSSSCSSSSCSSSEYPYQYKYCYGQCGTKVHQKYPN